MMKRLLIAAFLGAAVHGVSQNFNIQNMANYLRNKDYPKAKAAADAVIQHESTINSAKAWKYRGDVYKAIYDTSAADQLDKEAEEKALEAYVRCLELDKGKDNYKDDVYGNLVRSAGATLRKADYYVYNKEYDKALRCYDLLERSLPFDFQKGIMRQNISKEKLMYQRFEMYRKAGNKERTVEMASRLIESGYKEPKIYTDMVTLSLLEKDTTAALDYINKGRALFDENMELIGKEIDIYLARKKTDVLEKKVQDAITLSPDNPKLYGVLANIQNRSGKPDEAAKTYLKALEVDPDFDIANYNLGVIYYTQGKEWNDKQNKVPYGDKRFDEYDKKTKENFNQAVAYFEKYYEATQDAETKKLLLTLSRRLEDKARMEKYKN